METIYVVDTRDNNRFFVDSPVRSSLYEQWRRANPESKLLAKVDGIEKEIEAKYLLEYSIWRNLNVLR